MGKYGIAKKFKFLKDFEKRLQKNCITCADKQKLFNIFFVKFSFSIFPSADFDFAMFEKTYICLMGRKF